jgi:mRNA-degrading endonuclease RelE of RelBE toxin-antitoxin system
MEAEGGRYGFRVIVTRKALRDLAKLPPDDQARVRAAIGDLSDWPEHGRDVRKLAGRMPPTWRLREGNWRALFTVNNASREVEIGDVGPRDRIYN